MNRLRWLASPLAGTTAVLAGLSLLAIPLRQLTAPGQVPPVPSAQAPAPSTEIPAVLRLRLLAPAQHVTCTTATGQLLLDLRDPPVGESEHDARIPFVEGGLDVTIQADFGVSSAETAVFLTIMPDGYEDQTRYVIGSGALEESLRFAWHSH
jgi:hypothetical protein